MKPVVWALALAAAPLFQEAQRPLVGVVAPPAFPSLSAEGCAHCHGPEAAAWRTSRHAAAFTNALFQTSYRREPDPWCLNCHAPLPAQADSPLELEGITCAVCHVRDGAILSSRPPTSAGLEAHPIRVEAELGHSTFCAGCHQFNFPEHRRPPAASGRVVTYSQVAMQDTFCEWQRSGSATTCQGCHLPEAEATVDHRFLGGHDAEALRHALAVEVRSDGRVAEVTLRSQGVGHALPTGDPFRTLVVELCLDPGCDQVVARTSFGRTFIRGPRSWLLATETSVPPGPEGITQHVELDPHLGRPSRWRLTYRFPAQAFQRELKGEDRELEVARGTVEPR